MQRLADISTFESICTQGAVPVSCFNNTEDRSASSNLDSVDQLCYAIEENASNILAALRTFGGNVEKYLEMANALRTSNNGKLAMYDKRIKFWCAVIPRYVEKYLSFSF